MNIYIEDVLKFGFEKVMKDNKFLYEYQIESEEKELLKAKERYNLEKEEYDKAYKTLIERYPFIDKARRISRGEVVALTNDDRKQIIEYLNQAVYENEKINLGELGELDELDDDFLLTMITPFIPKGFENLKYEYIVKELNELKEEYKNIENEYHFVINAKDIKRNSKALKTLKEIASKLLKEGKDVDIVISKTMESASNKDRANYIYTDEELEILNELNDNLVKLGMKKSIGIDEASLKEKVSREKAWDFEDVLKANSEIDKVVNTILSSQLTPFEAMLYIHNYATQFKYVDSERIKGYSMEESRVIVGFYKNNKIVCSGYASIVKSIIDKLELKEYKGLECELVGCKLPLKKEFIEKVKSNNDTNYNVSDSAGHCHNIIKIKDKKYSIAGYYSEDSTWDSKRKSKGQEEEVSGGFAHCLYPIGDVHHFIKRDYKQELGDSRLNNLITGSSDPTTYSDKFKRNIKSLINKIEKESHSKPIPFETYGKGLTAMWNKVGDLEKASSDYVAKELEKSIEHSGEIFGAGASSEFVKLFVRNQAQEQNTEQSQEVGQKLTLQQKISKFVQKVIAKVKRENKEQQEDNTNKL